MNKIYLGLITILLTILLMPQIFAAHYVVGIVDNAKDSTPANNREIVLWNPANGINDNITDIIGPNGNSGTDNLYLVDCEELSNSCDVGDHLNVKIIPNGSLYFSYTVSVTVTGAGYDVAPKLTLNTPPSVQLIFPINNQNLSAQTINFTCLSTDPDSNLKNVTLYSNWSGSWQKDQTISISGGSTQTNFTKTLAEGTYLGGCFVTDNLSISKSSTNHTFTIDRTPPEITLITINQTIIFGTTRVRVECSAMDSRTDISSVIIQANSPTTKTNYTAQKLSQYTYYVDLSINEIGTWDFDCIVNDSANNIAKNTSYEINEYDINSRPSRARIVSIKSERAPTEEPESNDAYAENTTELNLFGYTVSQSWQGYFGNVSGGIQLVDSSGKIMYDWSNASQRGEVYSTRATNVNFSTTKCANSIEISSEESFIGHSSTDVDSVTNTFNQNNHPEFYVGAIKINQDSCKSTNIFDNAGAQTTKFFNILLSDGSSNIIYTSILERDAIGFDSRAHDFEMIVGENGHNGDTMTTPYYFYIEII